MNLHINFKKLAFAAVWGLSLVPLVSIGLYVIAACQGVLICIYAVDNKIITRI